MSSYYQIIISSPGPQGIPGTSASLAASATYAINSGSSTYSSSAATAASATISVSATYSSSAALVTSASGIPTRWFGSFYDSGSQGAVNPSLSYPMRFQYTDYANGISASGSSITFSNAGVYNIQWSGQFENTDSNDHDVCVWMKKNNSDIIGSTGLISIPGKHGTIYGHGIFGWNYIMSINAGDVIQMYWQTDSPSVTIQYYPGQINPTRPDTSSILLTAVQV